MPTDGLDGLACDPLTCDYKQKSGKGVCAYTNEGGRSNAGRRHSCRGGRARLRQLLHTVEGQKLEARAVVVSKVRTVGRSEVVNLAPVSPKDHLVLIASTITEATQQYIEERGWSWICVPRDHRPATGRLRFPGWDPVELGPREPKPGIPLHGKGRTPWGRFAVVRQLLRGHAWTQTELARSGRVSQPRVSQILAQLTRDDVVGRFMGTGDTYIRDGRPSISRYS